MIMRACVFLSVFVIGNTTTTTTTTTTPFPSISSLIELLEFPLVDMLLTFPLNEDGRDSPEAIQAVARFDQEVQSAIRQGQLLEKQFRRAFGRSIAENPAMHSWRRAVGFLAANLVNQLPDNPMLRRQGIRFIDQFLGFVKGLNLRNSQFIASKQVGELQSLLDTLVAEESLFSSIACDCERMLRTTPEPSEFQESRRQSFSSSSSEGGRLRGSDPHPHRPKACAVCQAARERHWELNFSETLAVLEARLSELEKKDKRVNCAQFFDHIGEVIDMWFIEKMNGHQLDVQVANFCQTRGENLLAYLGECKSRRFRSIILAVRFGRICGTELSRIARFAVIPSMLITTLTPIELERMSVVDPETEIEEEVQFWDQEIHVDGDALVESSFTEMASLDRFSFELPLEVEFIGSEAQGSGTRKEWAASFLDEILKPETSTLFEYSDDRALYVKPVPLRKDMDQESQNQILFKYRHIGRVMGVSIRDKQSPWAAFTPAAVALILQQDSERNAREWLQIENPALITSLDRLVKDYVTESWQIEGSTTPVPVADIGFVFEDSEPVTQDNVARYVAQTTQGVAFNSIRLQMNEIATGLFEVLPYGSLAFLTVEELGGLLRGNRDIDVDDLRASASYTPSDNVNESTQEVVWFWQILGALSESEKQDLVRFVSGSSLAPLHGFTGMTGDRKWLSVAVEQGLIVDQTPLAQTCFNQIRLPVYSSKEIMHARLLTAIQNAKTLENA